MPQISPLLGALVPQLSGKWLGVAPQEWATIFRDRADGVFGWRVIWHETIRHMVIRILRAAFDLIISLPSLAQLSMS
jgi:hypothetical protein